MELNAPDRIAVRRAFWINEIGRPLEALLKRASYSDSLREEFIAFFNTKLVPLLGPSPSEFTTSKPTTFLSDDHTPCEIIWAIGSKGEMSVRFALEPISSVDGSSDPPSISMGPLDGLAQVLQDCDLTWTKICGKSLVWDDIDMAPGASEELKHFSQFMFGGEINKNGILGKTYFFPSVRSAITRKPAEIIVGDFMCQLGAGSAWETMITPYFETLPKEFRPIPDMVSVDCLAPGQNRVKVYFRCQLSSLDAISDAVTLGGRISDDDVSKTLSALHHLWGLFFPGITHDAPLPTTRKGPYYPSGFLVYYELVATRTMPIPKVYIPVRHYCHDDAQIAAAITQYFKDNNLPDIAERYTNDWESFLPLASRTGIHAYVAICTKESGTRTYMYMCPEAFASERSHGDRRAH